MPTPMHLGLRPLLIIALLAALIGCQGIQTQPDGAGSEACDPMLASCAQAEDTDQSLYLEPIPVERETLFARVAELKRWLAWQRSVALGETDQPFEPIEALIQAAPEPMIEPNISAEERIQSVQLLADSGDLTQALTLAQELYDISPQDLDVLVLYSAMLTQNEQFERSIQIVDLALELYPQSAELYNNQAVNYAALGDLGQSIELFQTAFSTHPSFAQIQFNLKQLYQATARRALSPFEEFEAPSLTPILINYQPEPNELPEPTDPQVEPLSELSQEEERVEPDLIPTGENLERLPIL